MRISPSLSDHQVEECRKLVLRKAKRFFGRTLTAHDLEDTCSHTMLQILSKLSNFDETRGSFYGYVSQITDSSLLDASRQRRAKKHQGALNLASLHSSVDAGVDAATELWQCIDEQSLKRRIGGRTQTFADTQLGIDLQEASEHLTSGQRSLLKAKLEGHSATELARHFGVCRGTIYRRMVALRHRLSGLQIYLHE
ncbi:sigma-70 family RNA polymerase sigma factor [Aureliella helgolandensis]|uniref:RNA polymerase sigma factor SigE n=1 Tax=Aureliella helgolandensis TaxID=2527968 RepID=A0A518GBP3_9BACT|nr:sigma-70 family RNA polymerase sigma factor [Aureliella helgolandensis]QDV25957.1 RNA polymerase sigma factor SigE [Aureliella helgolandensis]